MFSKLELFKFSTLQERLGVKKQVFLLVMILMVSYGLSLFSFSVELENLKDGQKNFYHKQFAPQQQLAEYQRSLGNIRYSLTAVAAEIIPGPGGANKVEELLANANKLWESLGPSILNSSNEDIQVHAKKVASGHESLQEIVSDSIDYASAHDLDGIKEILEDDWTAIIINIEKPISEINRLQKTEVNLSYKNNMIRTSRFVKISQGAGGAVLLIILFVAYLVGAYLSKSSDRAINILRSVDGVLTRNFEQLQINAAKMEAEIVAQSSSMQETVVTLTEINEMIQKTVEFADATSNNMQETVKFTGNGKESVEKIRSYMELFRTSLLKVEETVHDYNDKMMGIVKVIEEVANKTALINDIVFQTKLLSFNASVEAARAGEQGKGFAVVAEEVGNLAQMSGSTAKEISSLINESMEYVSSVVSQFQNEMVGTIAENVQRIDEGVKLAKESDASLDDIVLSVSAVSKYMDGLQQAAREQAEGSQNIYSTMTDMEKSSLDHIQAAKANNKFTKEAHDNCQQLHQAISILTATVSGTKGEPRQKSKQADHDNGDEGSGTAEDREAIEDITLKSSNEQKIAFGERAG